MAIVCRLCGKNGMEAGRWLTRVNERGTPGVWECRPSCTSTLSSDDVVVAAIAGAEAAHQRLKEGQ